MDNLSIKNMVYSKNRIGRIIEFTFGLLLLAIAYNIFCKKCNLVYGVSGIGLMFNYKMGIDSSLIILICNIILLLFSYIFLGKESTRNTIVGSLLFPLFVKLTEFLGTIDLGTKNLGTVDLGTQQLETINLGTQHLGTVDLGTTQLEGEVNAPIYTKEIKETQVHDLGTVDLGTVNFQI